jgi:CRP/FNR family cyclic AMP-dependent transcriptional regulator
LLEEDEVTSLLGEINIFSALPEHARRRLAKEGRLRPYQRGQFLANQGDPGDWLFVILRGMVKVTIASEQGGEIVLTTVGPPRILGELAMLDGAPRSASVQAMEPGTTALILPREVVLPVLIEHPQSMAALLATLGGMIRRLTEQNADLVFMDLDGRVAKLLVRMAADRGVREGDAIVLDLRLTQGDLAHMVGGSRSAVNRTLQSFARRGLLDLQVQGQRLVIRDLDVLRRRAGL